MSSLKSIRSVCANETYSFVRCAQGIHFTLLSKENFRHIQARVLSDLSYVDAEYETIPINFQLTSIFDHSLHDAFSRVLHKLIDSLPYLEDLLNVFCAVSVSLVSS